MIQTKTPREKKMRKKKGGGEEEDSRNIGTDNLQKEIQIANDPMKRYL